MHHVLLLCSWSLFHLFRGMTFAHVIPVIYWINQREVHFDNNLKNTFIPVTPDLYFKGSSC